MAKLIDKQAFKLAEGKCRICGADEYAILDVHRIIEGKNQGRYERPNCVCLCANCHRKVHDKSLIIDRYYLASSGIHVLRIIENGEERFV